jgi:hypothetical protein
MDQSGFVGSEGYFSRDSKKQGKRSNKKGKDVFCDSKTPTEKLARELLAG